MATRPTLRKRADSHWDWLQPSAHSDSSSTVPTLTTPTTTLSQLEAVLIRNLTLSVSKPGHFHPSVAHSHSPSAAASNAPPLPSSASSSTASTVAGSNGSLSSNGTGSIGRNGLPRLFAADDMDLLLSHKTRRRRAGSSASFTGSPQRRGGPADEDQASSWVVEEEQASQATTPFSPSAEANSSVEVSAGDVVSASVPMRNRSTSRASLQSNGSGSTIRPPRPVRKRADTLIPLRKRQLLDSFVTLSLPSTTSSDSVSAASTPLTTDTVPVSSRAARKLNRTRAGSTASLPSSSIITLTPPSPPSPPQPPFFIAPPQFQTIHPRFDVDPKEFLVEQPQKWNELRSGRAVISVWVGTGTGKGKGKKPEVAVEVDERESPQSWRALCEWDVDFDALVSLGPEPTTFPPLPPNTLILRLHNEYFTPPIPRDPYDDSSEEEEEGNRSDPGVITQRRGRSRRWEEEESKRRKREIVEMSVRETRMVEPAGVDDIVRLLELNHELGLGLDSLAEISVTLESSLSETGDLTLSRAKAQAKDKADDVCAVREEMVLDLEDERAALAARRRALKARQDRLATANKICQQGRDDLAKAQAALLESQNAFNNVLASTTSRRTELITLLSHLYPIEPAIDAHDPSSLLFAILDLPLPNSSYPSSMSDDTLSSALGYTAQVTSMLAGYLAVPLHYPIQCLGSRSGVLDPISVMRGPRVFPLYGKGVDKYRFDYAVFLLNKNIEQLMYSQGLTVPDLRNTLPNLKALVLSLSFDPSHKNFSKSTLASPVELTALKPFPPLPSLTDDILQPIPSTPLPEASTSVEYLSSNGYHDDLPPSPDEPLKTPVVGKVESSESVERESDLSAYEDASTRSPSTIKAVSVRSLTPPPLKLAEVEKAVDTGSTLGKKMAGLLRSRWAESAVASTPTVATSSNGVI